METSSVSKVVITMQVIHQCNAVLAAAWDFQLQHSTHLLELDSQLRGNLRMDKVWFVKNN